MMGFASLNPSYDGPHCDTRSLRVLRESFASFAVTRCLLFFLKPAGIGFEAHQVLADGLEMLLPSLQLLRHRVDVAEAALEWVLVEDRGGAGGLIEDVDDLERGVDREGRGEADRHPLVQCDVAALGDRLGDVFERTDQIAPRRSQPRTGPGC